MTKRTQDQLDQIKAKAKATRERNRKLDEWLAAQRAPYLKAAENKKRLLPKVEALAADERGEANTRKIALAMAEKLRAPLPEPPRLPHELPRTLEELEAHKRKWDEIKHKEREAKKAAKASASVSPKPKSAASTSVSPKPNAPGLPPHSPRPKAQASASVSPEPEPAASVNVSGRAAARAAYNAARAARRAKARSGRTCLSCGKPLTAQRATARFCGPACRLQAWRGRR